MRWQIRECLKGRKIFAALVGFALASVALVFGTTQVAIQSIKFDLSKIGESVYEAHLKTGRWPSQIDDLEGTEYLKMPYRRDMLQKGSFIVIWQKDLNPNPEANRDRILAYNNGGLFARLGLIWVCRGNLTIERKRVDQVRAAEKSNFGK